MTATDQRTGYIAGLRALADVLEQHDDLPLPGEGNTAPITIWFHDEDARERMAAAVRVIPGSFTKHVWGGASGEAYLDLQGHLHGLRLDLTARREVVCTRRVVATREVTEDVPDPAALAAVPTVTVTRTEDVVEWDCGPILSDREPVSV